MLVAVDLCVTFSSERENAISVLTGIAIDWSRAYMRFACGSVVVNFSSVIEMVLSSIVSYVLQSLAIIMCFLLVRLKGWLL